MSRVKLIVAATAAVMGTALGGCSGAMPEWMSSQPPGPQVQSLRFESDPPGADVRTAKGGTCQTPCTLPVSAENQTVSFAKPGFEPQTVQVISRESGDQSTFSGMFGGGRDSRNRGLGGGSLLMFFLAPLAATLIQLAVSRSREYEADATGAHTTGNPYALASALQKLDAYSKRLPMQASPSTAHLFIVAPLISGASFANLFATHPPMAKRIERLTGRPPL